MQSKHILSGYTSVEFEMLTRMMIGELKQVLEVVLVAASNASRRRVGFRSLFEEMKASVVDDSFQVEDAWGSPEISTAS